jgi:hypothetical protein
MPHGWDGEAVTIRWTSSTPLLRKMLMASRLPTRRGPTASQKNRLPGPQWSPHFAAGLGRGYRPGLTGLRGRVKQDFGPSSDYLLRNDWLSSLIGALLLATWNG